MKRLIVCICLPLLMVACGGKHADDVPAEGQPATYLYSRERVSCRISAETANPSLRIAVGEWMSERLGGYYDGDVTDMNALVNFYGRAHTDSLRASLDEIRSDLDVDFEAEMRKAYETDQIVTYTLSTFLNLGGAHPTSDEMGATFRKSDGRRLTWDIIRCDRQYEFGQMTIESLKNYFGMDDNDLQQALGDQNYFNPPLPRTPPYFLENGVMLIYQQYEIAGYAMGMPSDTISYDRMAPLLTTWARRLTGK